MTSIELIAQLNSIDEFIIRLRLEGQSLVVLYMKLIMRWRNLWQRSIVATRMGFISYILYIRYIIYICIISWTESLLNSLAALCST